MDNATFAVALALIAVGFALLIAELFVTSGFLALAALAFLAAGIALPFYYGDGSTGLLTILGVVVGVPLLLGIALRTTSPAFGRRVLHPPGPEDDATVATMPVNVELEQLRGRVGRAISDLRPSGVADFDGKRIDTMSEGFLIAAGTWVRCVEVKAGRVVVRAVDGPDAAPPAGPALADLENLDFS